jgi:hypothetical protein
MGRRRILEGSGAGRLAVFGGKVVGHCPDIPEMPGSRLLMFVAVPVTPCVRCVGRWLASRARLAGLWVSLARSASSLDVRRRCGFAVAGGGVLMESRRGCDADSPAALAIPQHLAGFFHTL